MQDRNTAICRAYRNGERIADIAAAHGIHKWTVRDIARRGGCVIRESGRPRGYA